MLFPSHHRFHPRQQQERDRERRVAAISARMADIEERLHAIERQQQTQLMRIAQMQAQLDEVLRVITSLKR